MSINALTNAAAARRPDTFPLNTIPEGLAEIARAASTAPTDATAATPGAAASTAERSSAVETAYNVLFGYIPTEILTLYVAVLAALQGPTKSFHAPPWIAFWCFLVATPAVTWLVFGAKVKAMKKPLPLKYGAWPVWEMFAATIAFCAWAFALPNTPFSDFDWYSSALAGVAVLVASTMLGLLAPFFQRQLTA